MKRGKGSIVWVRPGLGNHEEPATILETNHHYIDPYDNHDEMEECTEENKDGVLIRYNVSLVETVVHKSKIRDMMTEEQRNDDAPGNRRRRSLRTCVANTQSTEISKPSSMSTAITLKRLIQDEEKKMELVDDQTNQKNCENDNATRSLKSTTRSSKGRTKPAQKPKRDRKTVSQQDQDLIRHAHESILTNGKKKALASPYFDDGRNKNHNDMTEENLPKKRRKISSSSTTSNAKAIQKTEVKVESGSSDEDDHLPLLSKKTKTEANVKTETAVKGKKTTKITQNSISKKNATKAGKPDGHGDLTMNKSSTYIIEYAKTGRSTCKRCDQRIQKNELRIGHRPLFRGKPGFRIYKHLNCIVFSSDVCVPSDVDGYDELNDEDFVKLGERIKESQIEIKEENEELDPDELVQKGFEGELRESPTGLKASLLPFQKEGVSWMYCQECKTPDIRGGILADEMGMGKTLQTITTLLDNRPKLQHSLPGTKHPPSCSSTMREKLDDEEKLWNDALKEWKHEMKMNDVPSSILPISKKSNVGCGGGARAGTLVVCPVIALTQWKSEIEKFCESNALSVCIYHGPDRTKLIKRELLRKYDVVLTTYQVIEQDFRKMISPNKVKCPNCGKKFKVDKLRVHLKYFCGDGAQRTEAQARTRRNSERNDLEDDRRRDRRNPRSSGGVKTGKEKKNMIKITGAGTSKNPKKVKDKKDYDSDDLSVGKAVAATKKSPRSAAMKAKRRVTTNARNERKFKKYADSTDEEDDEDYSSYESTFDDEVDNESSSEDEAVRRAKERQSKVLQQAKRKQLGKKSKDKSFAMEGKMKEIVTPKKKITGKSKGKKRSRKESDSESEYNSDDDDDFGVDMDALISEAMAGAQMSVLHSFCWWRVVLDEAHFIKSRSSQTSASAFALTSVHRWCLSGTPLQNRVGEFYSLVRFLRLDPMAHYMCRAAGCSCKQVHYRMMNGRCKDCGHSSIQHYSYFNRTILNPIQRDGYTNDGRRAMFTLKNEVLDKCLLRRTKETRAEDMNLPPRIVTIKSIKLHPIEEDFYNAVFTKTTSSFNDYVAEGTLLNNYAHIFDLLMRMRQSVCHPYLVVHSKKDKAVGRVAASSQVNNTVAECLLCSEPITEQVVSTCCQTPFCRNCVIEYMEISSGVNENGTGQTPCPSCRSPFTIDLTVVETIEDNYCKGVDQRISKIGLPSLLDLPHVTTGSILRRIDLTKFATSSKIEALTMELVNMRKKSPGSKAIVFSQFVNMLDLIRWRLHSDPFLNEMGLGVRAVQGSMDVKARDLALKDFREDPHVRVLLMSLKAGGVALNLTVANHIFLMDPWWNPAAEMQAIDRTHRLGQYRPIRAVRFIAANTVEERILQLQEKKRLVFDGTVGRDAGSLKMLTVDDMKSLFG